MDKEAGDAQHRTAESLSESVDQRTKEIGSHTENFLNVAQEQLDHFEDIQGFLNNDDHRSWKEMASVPRQNGLENEIETSAQLARSSQVLDSNETQHDGVGLEEDNLFSVKIGDLDVNNAEDEAAAEGQEEVQSATISNNPDTASPKIHLNRAAEAPSGMEGFLNSVPEISGTPEEMAALDEMLEKDRVVNKDFYKNLAEIASMPNLTNKWRGVAKPGEVPKEQQPTAPSQPSESVSRPPYIHLEGIVAGSLQDLKHQEEYVLQYGLRDRVEKTHSEYNNNAVDFEYPTLSEWYSKIEELPDDVPAIEHDPDPSST
ncbi:MAG: hypothetical protein Q9166_006917 [cf. Caloplaca sp. 2 TL-2023]